MVKIMCRRPNHSLLLTATLEDIESKIAITLRDAHCDIDRRNSVYLIGNIHMPRNIAKSTSQRYFYGPSVDLNRYFGGLYIRSVTDLKILRIPVIPT